MHEKYERILLTGGSGKLGQTIRNSGLFPSLLAPSREALDLRKPASIKKYFKENDMDAVIHCAALARIAGCEENPVEAIETNIIGTSHLVKETILKENKSSSRVRFIYISTDGVYPGIRGHYSEQDAVFPYSHYGWTKLGAECAVHLLPNFCIIRTSFFDPRDIKFDRSAADIYNSKMRIEELVKAIRFLVESDFVGTINIGSDRESDYNRYRKFKPELIPCPREEIFRAVPFKMASDSSLDISLWKSITQSHPSIHA